MAPQFWQFHTPLSSSCGCWQFGGIGGMGLFFGQSLGTPRGHVVVVVGIVVGVVVGLGAGATVVGVTSAPGSVVGVVCVVVAGFLAVLGVDAFGFDVGVVEPGSALPTVVPGEDGVAPPTGAPAALQPPELWLSVAPLPVSTTNWS
jgi:hypothetical protein